MSKTSIMVHTVLLRRAATQARAFARDLAEPTAKQGFLDLANKWENEASSLEQKNAPSQSLANDPGEPPLSS